MKNIALIIKSLVFISLLNACYSNRKLTTRAEYEKYTLKKRIRITNVLTNQGKTYEFNFQVPGKFSQTDVVGNPQLFLPYGVADSIIFNEKDFTPEIVWEEGKEYKVISQEKTRMVCYSTDTLHIPFSEIKELKLVKPEPGKTILFSAGFLQSVGIIILLLNPLDFSDMTM